MKRVAGKVALVTGGGSGLGKADCLMLAAEGAMVVVSDINVDAAKAVADEIGANAIAIQHDVSSQSDWLAAIAATEARFGGLNILVNNAGIVVIADPEETTLEQFRKANAVMSEGVFLGCKYAIPLMARSGGGSIINMSSTASHLGYPVLNSISNVRDHLNRFT